MKTACATLFLAACAEAAVTVPLRSLAARDAADRAAGRSYLRAKRASGQSVAISDWIGTTDLQWYATISVGTPGQNLSVLFDTGSSDLLLPSSACTACTAPHRFSSNASSSFSPAPGIRNSLTFGTGGTNVPATTDAAADGTIVADAVALAGSSFSVDSQAFLLFDNITDAFNLGGVVDGILGLPPVATAPHILPDGVNTTADLSPFWLKLNATGQIDHAVFGLWLGTGDDSAGRGGELTLGGLDASKYSGDLEYVPLYEPGVASAGEWIVLAPALSLTLAGSQTAAYTFYNISSLALLDSGTAYIQGPDNATVTDLYAQISSKIHPIGTGGAWGAACSELDALAPTLNISLAAIDGTVVNITIDSSSFNLGKYPGLNDVCQAVFLTPVTPVDAGKGVAFWTFGGPALKQYYTAWDADNQRVGFAKLSSSATANSTTGGNRTSTGTSTGTSSGASSTSTGSISTSGSMSVALPTMSLAATFLAMAALLLN